MSQQLFEQVSNVINSRRTVSRAKMNGNAVPDELINKLLQLGNMAPNHGRTQPWQFFVYTGDALAQFGKTHGALYWKHTDPEKRMEATVGKLESGAGNASHLVIAVMKRGANPRIPVIEEIAAASAAVQNILIGATAAGIATFWSTGGMTHSPALKSHLGLGDEDIVMGLLYFGYSDEPLAEAVRNMPISEKVKWL